MVCGVIMLRRSSFSSPPVADHGLGSFQHELNACMAFDGPGRLMKNDTRRFHPGHVLRPEGARLYRVRHTELHRRGGIRAFVAMVNIHVAVLQATGFK